MCIAATALALSLFLAGCAGTPDAGSLGVSGSPEPQAARADDRIGPIAAPVVDGPVAVVDSDPALAARATATAPTRLMIGALGIDMAVAPVGVAQDGQMEVPERAEIAGWYRYGPDLDADEGHMVLAAHVDDPSGIGPFARLRELNAGDRIEVRDGDRVRIYTVERIEQTDKREIDFADVFSRDGEPRLALITCGGSWDRQQRHYSDNVVVWALPEGSSP